MKFEAVLKGGEVIDPVNHVRGVMDVGIAGRKIAAVGSGLSGEVEWDMSGKTVFPGVIDMHLHVTHDFGGIVGYRMAAATGVTTIIDYAGPMEDILEHLPTHGSGLNVGCLQAVLPDVVGADPSRAQIRDFMEKSLKAGALGLKILGGHYPLTPEASRLCVEETNRRGVFVASHAGSTRQRSDIYGLKEAIEYGRGQRLLMAHINAYCRGGRYPYLEELRDAFRMLSDNPNIFSDAHMTVNNGTNGYCENGVPKDHITQNCLRMFGYPVTTEGMAQAIRDGCVKVIAKAGDANVLLEYDEALKQWNGGTTMQDVSFPANLPTVAAGCLLERKPGSREFLIPMAATDGGGYPRNGLLQKLLSYYRLGYLTLEEVAYKCSAAAARIFGLEGKGHLGVGADADVTAADLSTGMPVLSLAGGKVVMRNGGVEGSGGTLLTTQDGEAECRRRQIPYRLITPARSGFYEA